MLIVPAILEKNATSFFTQVKRLSPYFRHFQIDIADGRFVPNRTIQIESIENELAQFHFRHLLQDLVFDFHLMVRDYRHEVEKLQRVRYLLKIRRVFVHASLVPSIMSLVTGFPHFIFGLALNPEDSVERLKKKFTLHRVPAIQIMTIQPGFQGTEFLPEMLQKIGQLRKIGYRGEIFLDGGVNDTTLPLIASQEFLPDAVTVGSFFTKSKDLKTHIRLLREEK